MAAVITTLVSSSEMKGIQEKCVAGEPLCGFINRRLFPVKIHMFLYVGCEYSLLENYTNKVSEVD